MGVITFRELGISLYWIKTMITLIRCFCKVARYIYPFLSISRSQMVRVVVVVVVVVVVGGGGGGGGGGESGGTTGPWTNICGHLWMFDVAMLESCKNYIIAHINLDISHVHPLKHGYRAIYTYIGVSYALCVYHIVLVYHWNTDFVSRYISFDT